MFKINLDNQPAIKKADPNQVATSIANLPQQLSAAYTAAKKTKLPIGFGQAQNIVFCGMGGSNLASELIKRVFGSQIKAPFVLVRGYHLPAFASSKTLAIISSYSGNTEETLSCLNQALKAKAKIIIVTSGGQLEKLAKKYRLPCFLIDPKFNPSGQPRYDVGSQLGVTLAIFAKLKLIKITDAEINQAAADLVALGFTLLPDSPTIKNSAKQLAEKLYQKNLYLVSAEHLSANGHILANQINESAKQLASPYRLPELNHHLLEALSNPAKVIKETAFVFIASTSYSPRVKARIIATQKVLKQQGVAYYNLEFKAGTPLTESLKLVMAGSWLSFYLAMLNKVNPASIPWVEMLKKELGK